MIVKDPFSTMLYRYRNIARHLAGAVLAVSSTLVLGAGPSKAALSVTASTDASAMAAALIGPGITLVPGSASYIGAADASGFFLGDTSIFGNPAGASGVLFTNGSVTNALPAPPPDPWNNIPNATKNNQFQGSNYLNEQVPGINTVDASTLTFKITLNHGIDGIQWTYAFGSEEYLEFVGEEYNDIFALSLSQDGINFTNLALIPSTSLPVPVAINNVNDVSNPQYYRNNPVGSNTYFTQYNGLTTVLTSTATGLTPGQTYTLSFAIADATDFSYDSGVFLLARSIRGPVSDVPGPLPLLGAGAALVWSRRLRSRINESVRSR
jgi:hypothetical protein